MFKIFENTSVVSDVKLLWESFKYYKAQIFILISLGFLAGLFEGLGINAAIPLFSFVAGGGSIGTDLISVSINKSFIYFNIPFTLNYLLVFMSSLFIFRAIFAIASSYLNIKIAANYEEKMRNHLLESTLAANWNYLIKQKIGYLETIIMTNVRYSELMLSHISSLVVTLSSLLVYVFIALNISLPITTATIILNLILFLIFKPLIGRAQRNSTLIEDANKRVAHYVNENVVGMKSVKVMRADSKVASIGRTFFEMLKRYRIKISLLRTVPDALMQPIGFLFIVTVFLFSYKTPGFSIAVLGAVAYLIQRIFLYGQMIQGNLHMINECLPYLREMKKYESTVLAEEEKDTGLHNFLFRDVLEFKNISFSYNENRPILDGINFSIKQGEMVGLIGPSGSGKTTVVDLLLRLFVPNEGKILLDGKNISTISLSDWRKNIGYVSQDIFLINDTIRNNIRFHDDAVSEQDIKIAAKQANISDFIESLPSGYDTVIGERGVMLSGGQRQRIVIARILAHKPKFLILDEATSALDGGSEAEIQKVIENLKGKLTVLVIAHRLSTIINSDRIIVLSGGKNLEEGKPADLLADKESYFFKVYNIRKN